MYGCILVHGCVAAATEGWWLLDPLERKLLTIAITSENICTARDIPVFLPCKSPNVRKYKLHVMFKIKIEKFFLHYNLTL